MPQKHAGLFIYIMCVMLKSQKVLIAIIFSAGIVASAAFALPAIAKVAYKATSRHADRYFAVSEIPDSIFSKMQGKSYKADCTVPRSELRLVNCLIKDKNGATHHGQLIVNKLIAARVVSILKQLYHAGYPIERMQLIDKYNANDELSMRANNSSAFNFRRVSHTNKLSNHSRGLAIDINPLYNPYRKQVRGKLVVEPATGRPYLDRNRKFAYKITRGDLCWRLFTQAGFSWGGDWKSVKDYQHFEYIVRK